jgi:hypothetical protein
VRDCRKENCETREMEEDTEIGFEGKEAREKSTYDV